MKATYAMRCLAGGKEGNFFQRAAPGISRRGKGTHPSSGRHAEEKIHKRQSRSAKKLLQERVLRRDAPPAFKSTLQPQLLLPSATVLAHNDGRSVAIHCLVVRLQHSRFSAPPILVLPLLLDFCGRLVPLTSPGNRPVAALLTAPVSWCFCSRLLLLLRLR